MSLQRSWCHHTQLPERAESTLQCPGCVYELAKAARIWQNGEWWWHCSCKTVTTTVFEINNTSNTRFSFSIGCCQSSRTACPGGQDPREGLWQTENLLCWPSELFLLYVFLPFEFQSTKGSTRQGEESPLYFDCPVKTSAYWTYGRVWGWGLICVQSCNVVLI